MNTIGKRKIENVIREEVQERASHRPRDELRRLIESVTLLEEQLTDDDATSAAFALDAGQGEAE